MSTSPTSPIPQYSVKTIQEILPLIDWINSLDIPSCALVDQIQDLKSGVVIGDIIAWILEKEYLQGLKRDVITIQDCIENWKIILQQLQPFLGQAILKIHPQDILQDQQSVLRILRFLAQLQDPNIVNIRPRRTKTFPKEKNQTFSIQDLQFQTPKQPISQSRLKKQSSISKPPVYPKTQPKLQQEGQIQKRRSNRLQNYSVQIPKQLPNSPLEQTDHQQPQKPPQQTHQEAKPIAQDLKNSIIFWLQQLHIIRKNALDSSILPNICRTGVLFCDLVNRLQGRDSPIKGFQRNPKNRTQALSNVNKVLQFIRKFPKMNGRYLWSAKEILQANQNVIWGLLQDFKSFYCINKHIRKTKSQSKLKSAAQLKLNLHLQQQEQQFYETGIGNVRLKEKKGVRSYALSARSRSPVSFSPNIQKPLQYSDQGFFADPYMEQQVRKWLEALEIHIQQETDILIDPLRNGVVLGELLKITQGIRVQINLNPRNIKQIKENFSKVFSVFIQKKAGITTSLLSDLQQYIADPQRIWVLLYSISNAYPQSVPLIYQPSSLPYNAVQIRMLEQAIINWLVKLEIINADIKLQFIEIIGQMKHGLLLCEVVSRVFERKIPSVVLNPTTEQSALNNIRKALELLRKHPRMSQKFVWSEKEVVKGNASVILGLLEDVYRVYDGMQARRTGMDYHRDGPYLGKSNVEDQKRSFGGWSFSRIKEGNSLKVQ